jgi:hypothetical protein
VRGSPRALFIRMKRKSLSNVALACQLFVATAGLSLAAPNVKIISRDGTVMLKGTVKSDEEKKAIEDKATEVAGQGKVTSELTPLRGRSRNTVSAVKNRTMRR